jgi:hypothetical protein
MRRASVRTMRRWGMAWLVILRCVIGLHATQRAVNGCCPRCGAEL